MAKAKASEGSLTVMMLRFAKSLGSSVEQGTRLQDSEGDGLVPVLVDEGETLNFQGSDYLIVQKEGLKPIGAAPATEGYEFLFEDDRHNVRQRTDGTVDVTFKRGSLRKGMTTAEGYVVETGEDLAAVRGDDGEVQTLPLSRIHPAPAKIREGRRAEAVRRIYKSLVTEEFDRQLEEARKRADKNPTDARKKAGNYKKGHIEILGLDITIENPKGSYRRGVSKEGKRWKTKMNNDYGYFRGTKAKDKDQVDVFLGDNIESPKVFVVDQVDPKTRKFDEPKVMLGFNTKREAEDAYYSNYEEDWNGLGAITEMDIEQFKNWVKSDEAQGQASMKLLKSVNFPRLRKSRVLTQEEAGNVPDMFKRHFKVEGVSWGPTDAREGDTRSFGPNDLRRLARTPNGILRWMNADEFAKNQKHLLEMKQEQQKLNAPSVQQPQPPTASNPLQKIITAIQRGKTPPPPKPIEPPKEPAKTLTKRPDLGTPIEKAPGYMNEPQEQVEMREREERIAAAEAKERAIRSTKEYKAFTSKAAEDGFQPQTDFAFHTTQTVKFGDKESTAEFRRVYDSETKEWTPFLDGKTVTTKVDGKRYEVIGYKGDKIQLRDVGTHEERMIHPFELSTVKGELQMDEDGTLYIAHGSGDRDAVIRKEGLSDTELMQPGLIGSIDGEIWKRVETAEGAVYQDVFIGRVAAKGIVDYKDENQLGIRDAEGNLTRVDRQSLGRDYPDDRMKDDLRRQQRIARRRKEKVRANTSRINDLSMAKSSVEALTGQGPREMLSTFNYQSVTAQFIGQTDEVVASLASKYGTSEWNASVDRLAQMMKAHDEAKNADMAELNHHQPEGVVKLIPRTVHSYDSYRETAERALTDARSEFNRKRLAARIQNEREGDQKAKFDWDETSDQPTVPELTGRKRMKIRDSKNNTYYVRYAFVPKHDVVESHDIEGNPNVDHPSELQARKRSEAHSVSQMQRIARDINDDVVQDTSDATRGAPVTFSKQGKYYVVQGNGRTAGVKGAKGEQEDKYLGMLREKAKELGIDPEKVDKNFMLVRVMEPEHTYEDARRLGAFGQESSALPLSEVEQARAFQNAQREPLTLNINLKDIGGRSIEENNVHTFIHNNPKLYDQIVKDSGYDRTSIESHPETQARIINTALLAQLKSNFIDHVAGQDDKAHLLVKRIAPALALNQKQVQEGKLPHWADLQNVLGNVFRVYNNLDAHTKSMMTNRNGTIDFLSEDEHNGDPNTLLHRMRQEELGSVMESAKEVFRDPLAMVTLIAYHQAANTRVGEQTAQKTALSFALKVRRFENALQQIAEDKQDDLFAAMGGQDARESELTRKVLNAAEQTMLRNKSMTEETQGLTNEEQEVGNEESLTNGVLSVMEKAKKLYGIQLTTDKSNLSKSFLGRMFMPPTFFEFENDMEEVKAYFMTLAKSAEQMSLFPTREESSEPSDRKVPTGPAWNVPGGEKPGHKWLKRKRAKSGEHYDYQYEEPKPKEPTQPTMKTGHKGLASQAFKVGEPVANQNGAVIGKIAELGDGIAVIEEPSGQKVTYDAKEIVPIAHTGSLKEMDADEIFGPEARKVEVPQEGSDRDFVSKEIIKRGYFLIPKAKIENPGDLALICRRLGDQNIERAFVVPVDKDNRVVGIIPHTIGIVNSSLIDPGDLAHTLSEIGADGYYLMHNHPSGKTDPSRDDLEITTDLGALASKMGKKFHGHMIIGKNGFALATMSDDTASGYSVRHYDYPTNAAEKTRGVRIPVFGKRRVVQGDQPPDALNNAGVAAEALSKLSKNNPGMYMAALDAQGKINGFHLISPGNEARFREKDEIPYLNKAVGLALHNNASAVLFYYRQKEVGIETDRARKLQAKVEELLGHANIETADVIVDNGQTLYSTSSGGFLPRVYKSIMAIIRGMRR